MSRRARPVRSRPALLALALLALCALPHPAAAKAKAKAKPKAKAAARKNEAPPGVTESERRLQAELDQILAQKIFKSSRTGVHVIDLKSGRVLYSLDADRQLNPASNIKLVSTATALDVLGPDFTYETRVYGRLPDRDGVVHGDLWLVGMGDPTLRERDLGELAEALAARGIERVTGDLVVSDDRERDALAKPRYEIKVSGGAAEGQLAQVEVSPDSAYFVIENEATVSAKAKVAKKCRKLKGKKHKGKKPVCGPARAAGLTVKSQLEEGEQGARLVIRVSGKIRPGMSWRAVRDAPLAPLFTAHTLRAHIKQRGVEVGGGVRVEAGAVPPAELTALAVHHSVPLSQLCAMINKPSSNFLADRLIRLVGATMFGGEASFENGVRAMTAFLQKVGVDGKVLLANGSGLSYEQAMSARQIAQLLAIAWRDFEWAKSFVESLAVGGQDGTIRGRFKGHKSAGHVYAKTGTLTSVVALSGYVTLDGDDVIVFATLSNGFNNKRKQSLRAGEVQIVDAIFRHVERVEAEQARAPAPVEAETETEAEAEAEAEAEPEAEPAPETEAEPDEKPVEGWEDR